MSQQSTTSRPLVLADAWPLTRAHDAILVALYACFIGLTAQVSIPLPFTPVPITGQTFGVLAGALALGSQRSGLGVLLYLAVGLLGVPWFAQGQSGIGTLHLPTVGYLVGFVPAALLAGRLAETGLYRSPWGAFATMAVCSAAVYLFGVSGLMLTLGWSLAQAVAQGVLPFLFGDAVKALLAAVALPGAARLITPPR